MELMPRLLREESTRALVTRRKRSAVPVGRLDPRREAYFPALGYVVRGPGPARASTATTW